MTEQLAQFLDTAAPIQQALAQPETDAVVANLEAGRCHIFTSGRPTQVQDLPQGLGLSAGAVGTFGPWRVEVFGRQMVVFERVRMPEEPRGEGAQGLLARIESELGGHLVTQGPLLAEALLQWIGQRLGQIHPRALILHVGDFPAPLEGVMHLGAVGSDFVPGLDAATRQLERLCARADVILWASPSDDTSQWLRTLGRATVWTTGPKAPYGTWTATLEEDGEGRVQVTALSHDVSLTPMDAPKASPPPSEEEGPEEEGQDDEAKVPEEEPPTLPQRSLAPEADEVQEDTTKEEAARRRRPRPMKQRPSLQRRAPCFFCLLIQIKKTLSLRKRPPRRTRLRLSATTTCRSLTTTCERRWRPLNRSFAVPLRSSMPCTNV